MSEASTESGDIPLSWLALFVVLALGAAAFAITFVGGTIP